MKQKIEFKLKKKKENNLVFYYSYGCMHTEQ
jgi:hypothetical protein